MKRNSIFSFTKLGDTITHRCPERHVVDSSDALCRRFCEICNPRIQQVKIDRTLDAVVEAGMKD